MLSVKSRPASVLVKLDMSVAMAPGATAFTRTPRSPRSEAKCFTSVAIAPFVAAYAASVPTAALAARDETKTMLLPLPRIGSSCWTRKKGARTFTAKSLSKSSTVVSSMVADFEIPALATRTSSRSDRQQLLDEEERRANVYREEPVKILDRGLLDGRRLRDSGIGDEDV